MDSAIFRQLFEKASEAHSHSYAPVSNFNVGAALRTVDGEIFSGTNVEDYAFNSTIHAEACAIGAMVAMVGRKRISDLVVVADTPDKSPVTPCGHCRQLLVAFTDGGMNIVCASTDGAARLTTTHAELLPHAFGLTECT